MNFKSGNKNFASQSNIQLICEWSDCSQSFLTNVAYRNHVTNHIQSCIPSPDDPLAFLNTEFICKWNSCGQNLEKSFPHFMRHVYYHCFHTKIKTLAQEALKSVSDLPQCNSGSGNRNILPELPESFACQWSNCGFTSDDAESFYGHVSNHCDVLDQTGKSFVSCEWIECSVKAKNKYKLKEHMRAHTQEKLFSCPICGQLFSNRTKLLDHYRRQSLAKGNFSCPHCDKTFPLERLARDHIRRHVNSMQCPHCELSFCRPSNLQHHILYTHTEDRNFPCLFENCTYRAKSKYDLTEHYRTHAQHYPCDYPNCYEVFRTKHAAIQHYKSQHEIVPFGAHLRPYVKNKEAHFSVQTYQCHMCEKTFSRGSSLTQHLVKFHGLQKPSGHKRFRYVRGADGLMRVQTVRLESVDLVERHLEARIQEREALLDRARRQGAPFYHTNKDGVTCLVTTEETKLSPDTSPRGSPKPVTSSADPPETALVTQTEAMKLDVTSQNGDSSSSGAADRARTLDDVAAAGEGDYYQRQLGSIPDTQCERVDDVTPPAASESVAEVKEDSCEFNFADLLPSIVPKRSETVTAPTSTSATVPPQAQKDITAKQENDKAGDRKADEDIVYSLNEFINEQTDLVFRNVQSPELFTMSPGTPDNHSMESRSSARSHRPRTRISGARRLMSDDDDVRYELSQSPTNYNESSHLNREELYSLVEEALASPSFQQHKDPSQHVTYKDLFGSPTMDVEDKELSSPVYDLRERSPATSPQSPFFPMSAQISEKDTDEESVRYGLRSPKSSPLKSDQAPDSVACPLSHQPDDLDNVKFALQSPAPSQAERSSPGQEERYKLSYSYDILGSPVSSSSEESSSESDDDAAEDADADVEESDQDGNSEDDADSVKFMVRSPPPSEDANMMNPDAFRRPATPEPRYALLETPCPETRYVLGHKLESVAAPEDTDREDFLYDLNMSDTNPTSVEMPPATPMSTVSDQLRYDVTELDVDTREKKIDDEQTLPEETDVEDNALFKLPSPRPLRMRKTTKPSPQTLRSPTSDSCDTDAESRYGLNSTMRSDVRSSSGFLKPRSQLTDSAQSDVEACDVRDDGPVEDSDAESDLFAVADLNSSRSRVGSLRPDETPLYSPTEPETEDDNLKYGLPSPMPTRQSNPYIPTMERSTGMRRMSTYDVMSPASYADELLTSPVTQTDIDEDGIRYDVSTPLRKPLLNPAAEISPAESRYGIVTPRAWDKIVVTSEDDADCRYRVTDSPATSVRSVPVTRHRLEIMTSPDSVAGSDVAARFDLATPTRREMEETYVLNTEERLLKRKRSLHKEFTGMGHSDVTEDDGRYRLSLLDSIDVGHERTQKYTLANNDAGRRNVAVASDAEDNDETDIDDVLFATNDKNAPLTKHRGDATSGDTDDELDDGLNEQIDGASDEGDGVTEHDGDDRNDETLVDKGEESEENEDESDGGEVDAEAPDDENDEELDAEEDEKIDTATERAEDLDEDELEDECDGEVVEGQEEEEETGDEQSDHEDSGEEDIGPTQADESSSDAGASDPVEDETDTRADVSADDGNLNDAEASYSLAGDASAADSLSDSPVSAPGAVASEEEALRYRVPDTTDNDEMVRYAVPDLSEETSGDDSSGPAAKRFKAATGDEERYTLRAAKRRSSGGGPHAAGPCRRSSRISSQKRRKRARDSQ